MSVREPNLSNTPVESEVRLVEGPPLISQDGKWTHTPDAVLTVKLVNYDDDSCETVWTGNMENPRSITHVFVCAETMTNSSPFFHKYITEGRWKMALESKKGVIELHNVDPEAMLIIFRILHNLPATVDVPVQTLWNIACAADRLQLFRMYIDQPQRNLKARKEKPQDIQDLNGSDRAQLDMMEDRQGFKDWVKLWDAKQHPRLLGPGEEKDLSNKLIFPFHLFDHAEGFARITKDLMYNTVRYIHEINPTIHGHLFTPHPIMSEFYLS
jgi:hypothetical protein